MIRNIIKNPIYNILNQQSDILLLLPTLVAVADSENFRDAAGLLRISQASVTQHMKSLEGRFSTPLFKVVGKRKELTEFGQELSQMAREQMAGLATSLVATHNRFMDPASQVLRVGARPEILEFILPKFGFKGSIVCTSDSTANVVDLILHAKLDLAIAHSVPDSGEILSRPAFESSPVLIVHKKIIGRDMKPLSAEFLKSTPALFYKKRGDTAEELAKSFGLLPSDLKCRVACEDWSVLKSLVEKKMGFALVPDYVTATLSEEVMKIELKNPEFKKFSYFYLFRREQKKEILSWL